MPVHWFIHLQQARGRRQAGKIASRKLPTCPGHSMHFGVLSGRHHRGRYGTFQDTSQAARRHWQPHPRRGALPGAWSPGRHSAAQDRAGLFCRGHSLPGRLQAGESSATNKVKLSVSYCQFWSYIGFASVWRYQGVNHVMLLRRRSAQDFNTNPMEVYIFWKLRRRRIRQHVNLKWGRGRGMKTVKNSTSWFPPFWG